jgi:rRNA-processing protein FCF1
MNDTFRELFRRYKTKGVLVDTNILLLWFVGAVNRERISRFNRTEKFIPEDYDLLVDILLSFDKIVTTPNILTEVNSLANQLGEPDRSKCLAIFAKGVARLDEFYIESRNAAGMEKFAKFGLTDCGIIELAKDRYLVLTDDLKLAGYLEKLGIDTVNFNNLRPYGWK